jgi:fatty-acid desaturase
MARTGLTSDGSSAAPRKISRGRQWFATALTLTKIVSRLLLDKYYYVPIIIVAIGLFAIGGFSMLLWGVALRIVMGWHFTWLVNSATHLWGTRRFDTRDDSRNNGLIAAVTFGEGWHNNHHAHPRSARHGLTWAEFDVNWVQIRLLEKLGVVSSVYAYSEKAKEPSSNRFATQRNLETNKKRKVES